MDCWGCEVQFIIKQQSPLYITNPAQALTQNLRRVFHFNRAAFEQKIYINKINGVTSLVGVGTTTK